MPARTITNESLTMNLAADILYHITEAEQSDSYVIDATLVPADANGRKVLPAGSFITKITASNAYGPFAAAATDGRQTITRGACAFTTHELDVTDGAKAVGGYYGATVFKTNKLTLNGATVAAIQTAVPTFEFR